MKKDDQKEYRELCQLSKKSRLLESVSQLLEWDQETYMPKDGAGVRAEQIELLAGIHHKEKTSPRFASALSKLIDLESGTILAKDLAAPQKAALREWRRDYLLSTALPNRFVQALAKLSSESLHVWTKARKENSFSDFAPYLKRIVEMQKEKAEYLGYQEHPYDALLDSYEPRLTVKEVSPLFEKIGKEISLLLNKIMQSKQVNAQFLHGSFSPQKQIKFNTFLLKSMGYDFQKGRLDLSTHPFASSFHPFDNRLTTRIHPTYLYESISSTMHEGGHGLYEMGLLSEHYGTPLCEAISLGIHESQSRFWETLIGLSQPFWKYYLPHLKKMFSPKLDSVTLPQFYRAINQVTPSLIRVEADEVTYSLHVIVRFIIEKELIEGSCSVEEIPERWNGLMQTYLGVTPPTDREGCLQDIHWSMGGMGYFPTYALGNLYASQFFDAFAKSFPDWKERLAKGELLFIKEWLHANIHRHGRAFTAKELVKHVTGKALSAEPYLKYLNEKYAEIYKFS